MRAAHLRRGRLRVLLDTHSWLWLATEPERVSPKLREDLKNLENQLFLSAASAWEIAIKYASGKLRLPEAPWQFVPSRMVETGTAELAITHAHALRAGELPLHHKDPFDRLLIAQAQIERLSIVTADRAFAAYDVEVIAP